RALDILRTGGFCREMLPDRIMIFGISYLPAFHLSLFFELSRHIDIHFFVTNPCRHLWDYIRSGREIQSIVRKTGKTRHELFLEQGNSLLASLGRQGRDFFSLVHSAEVNEEIHERFITPDENTMLHCIQADILAMRERIAAPGFRPVDPHDRSIRLHSCHSPLREVEVLHDTLVSFFDEDPSLTPGDICVLTPDIEEFTPFIQAVFDYPDNERLKIPYELSDRSIARQSEIIETFLNLIELPSSRFTASEVVGLLEKSAVRSRFEIDSADLETIRFWLGKTNIRWGLGRSISGSSDRAEDHPNTWEHGLNRLLMGYAVSSGDDRCIHGILPFDSAEGNDARLIGKLAAFIDTMARYAEKLAAPAPFDIWKNVLNDMITAFFSDNEHNQRDIQALRAALSGLSNIMTQVPFSTAISIEPISLFLKRHFEHSSSSSGFFCGKLCFAELLPMRSIPFKVICLMGMNYASYPRTDHQPAFNLIRSDPRPGDRSRREDDRYLFLETILSARDKLHISYTGKNLQDNSEIPPSVLVSELTDYISRGFFCSGEKTDPRDVLVVNHSLHAFSRKYFSTEASGSQLFSYSQTNAQASRAVHTPGKTAPFIATPLPTPAFETISLEELFSFFSHPSRYFLRNSLGIRCADRYETLDDDEPFSLDPLQKYLLACNLIDTKMNNCDMRDSYTLAREKGILPHGSPGKYAYTEASSTAEALYSRIKKYLDPSHAEEIDIDIPLDTIRITGSITAYDSTAIVRARPAKIKATDHIAIHLSLLAATVSRPEISWCGLAFTADKSFSYAKPENARDVFAELVNFYMQGNTYPLPFIPKCSWKYAQALHSGSSHGEALTKAINEWFGGPHTDSESNDPSYRLCFRNKEPFNGEFCHVAETILIPIMQTQRKL
ncbi:MAG: exodeoxyribonuclease V subunit gamma, partial [Chitinivibrionales bacterium]|nr:exodeoxyribonuclease V subunit gamma [Chitinivibrionales bacterium]